MAVGRQQQWLNRWKLVGDEMDPHKAARTEPGHTENWPENSYTAVCDGE